MNEPAFSTCWNSGRHTRGEQMLAEIAGLGFHRVELGHGVRLSLWDGIVDYLGRHELEVTSLHNFCPLPVQILRADPDCYQCTSHRPEERERAARYTRQTIDWAATLRARYVVLHLGSVPMPPYTDKLIALIRRGHYLDRGYVKAKIAALKAREGARALVLERVRQWLVPLAQYAKAAGVKLAIENRIGLETVPSEREFAALFGEADFAEVGYWHDFGHAQVRANLGWIDHREWLTAMKSRLFGAHVHDVRFPDLDHLAPFTGMTPWAELFAILPPETLCVWEMSPRLPAAEIIAALAKWRVLGQR
ncbi:MAG: sugar phosphate isomerase/epimerase [Verrucomicrobia bacterium]|nr:sugar phosphate isomerase/epimerase [Verrucomicrobiota bacterium]